MTEIAAGKDLVAVTTKEIVGLAAIDSIFFCRTFLPKTFRQESAPFHREVFETLENQNARHIGLEIFRDGAKTTILRAFTCKRVCYGSSRTIMFVSASQQHSIRSVRWIKKQIEFNTKLTQTFGLRRGTKWTDEWLEIEHMILGITISIVAVGITGQTRGLNIEDYRPDLIVVDDPSDEENTATPEQRLKQEQRFFGAIEKSLAPATENSAAKMVLLQTSLHKDDIINKVHRDGQWVTKKFSCFDSLGESTWPARYPTVTLKADKQAHIDRNQLLLWLREKECRVGDESQTSFRGSWLKYFEKPPERMIIVGAIDPVPPPSDKKLLDSDTDFEALAIVGYSAGDIYLLDYSLSRGHTPEWTATEFFRLSDKWRPMKWRVESVGYQRTLIWLLRRAMDQRKRFLQIDEVDDKRKKFHRIVQAFAGVASNGHLFIRKEQNAFIEAFIAYPSVSHDDVLDAPAMAIDALLNDPIMSDAIMAADLPPGELEAVPARFRSAP